MDFCQLINKNTLSKDFENEIICNEEGKEDICIKSTVKNEEVKD